MALVQVSNAETLSRLRERCVGVVPLDARMETWMVDVLESKSLPQWLDSWGSPLNVLCDGPFRRNVNDLIAVAANRQLDFEVYFARKANKCLQFVDVAREIGCGVDVASEAELVQALENGSVPTKIVCTAAIKSESLVRLCVARGVVMVVDNLDELALVTRIADARSQISKIALRVSGFLHKGVKLFSRFGFDVKDVGAIVSRLKANSSVALTGLHFHLDGYCPQQRVTALRETLLLIDHSRNEGHAPSFIDMGGGIPMSYLEHGSQWQEFWKEHRRAILGQRDTITYRNHTLGLTVVDDDVYGTAKSYPYHQSPIQEAWFAQVLDSECEDSTVLRGISRRGIQLRCEPGRSVLDGCGMTVARVEFRKRNSEGDWLIGLSMNRTQCRTSSDDFMVDPIVLSAHGSGESEKEPMVGYLVGAYCTESELLSLRKLRFPKGVAIGDVVVFPNTAGYLMHFLESRSHQFPLANNVFVHGITGAVPVIDAIDRRT